MMDEPADPFDSPVPREFIEHLRQAVAWEAAQAFEGFLREFSAAQPDNVALFKSPGAV
jgi:hypothetical protein